MDLFYNYSMKKIFFILAFILASAYAFSDDGGSYYPEEWTYGNIYVKEPNQKISLENEVLSFDPYGATAIFDFANTTKESVKVPCSFPVVIEIPYVIENNQIIPDQYYTYISNKAVWQIALNRYIKDEEFKQGIPFSEIQAKDKTLRVVKYADYIKELKSYGVLESRNDSSGKYQDGRYGDRLMDSYSGCKIIQDGKNIPLQNVGIEVTLSESTKVESEKRILLVLHFYHELEFKPSVHSTVKISYDVVADKSYKHSIHYKAYYDISTGGTWKGNIKNFVVNTDMNMDIVNGSLKPQKIVQEYAGLFYIFNEYKPAADEYFIFTKTVDGEDSPYYPLFEKDFAKQNFVSDIKSSSYLNGSFTYNQVKDYDDLWEPVEKKSGYAPETSFDTDPYNGWVEGVKGDGKGEWIGFTLSKWAIGPFAINGLTKYCFNQSKNVNDEPHQTWLENNRIKSMKLSSSKGNICTLRFRDEYSGFEYCADNQIEKKYKANSVVNPQILKPDSYRMEIAEIYKGTKYDDTVLGEVWFMELDRGIVELLLIDEKLANPIFKNYLLSLFYCEKNPSAEYNMKTKIYGNE